VRAENIPSTHSLFKLQSVLHLLYYSSSILSRIIKQGEEEKRAIRLITLKGSRANSFYLKNGFKLVDNIEYDNVYIRQCGRDGL
jgi:hypothetical protein